jgi:hypothetical protein
MGASSSVEKTRQQKDIEYLGNRMPFGDAELLQVYRVYQKLQQKLCDRGEEKSETEENPVNNNNIKSSFLKDVGALSASESLRKTRKRSTAANPPSEDQIAKEEKERASILEERLYLLEAVERKILPSGFGNTLYQTCFLGASKLAEYNEQGTHLGEEEDEYTRMAKLEKFFEGLANGTRRDRKTVTRCLIKCCMQHPPPPEESEASTNQFAANNFAYGGGGYASNETKNHKTCIDPMELVDMGYRLCLAAAFLKEASGGNPSSEGESENEQDLGRFLPDEDSKRLKPGLKALSNSLASLSTKRKQRRLHSTSPSDELAALVDEDDVFEWVERVAPMFGSILPTFLHSLFFPNKPAPPTRSSFDYPRISQESTVFPTNSSPLLFSFGCMSPSLGGEVGLLYGSVLVAMPALLSDSHFSLSRSVLSLVHLRLGRTLLQSGHERPLGIRWADPSYNTERKVDLWSLHRLALEGIQGFLRESRLFPVQAPAGDDLRLPTDRCEHPSQHPVHVLQFLCPVAGIRQTGSRDRLWRVQRQAATLSSGIL